MDKIKFTSFILLVTLMLGHMVLAQSPPNNIISLYVADDPETETPETGQRDQQPFYDTCTITEEGLSFSSTEESEIVAYELYDQKGSCLGHFCDQADFLTALFSRPGTYEVRFQTEKAVLLGCVQI